MTKPLLNVAVTCVAFLSASRFFICIFSCQENVWLHRIRMTRRIYGSRSFKYSVLWKIRDKGKDSQRDNLDGQSRVMRKEGATKRCRGSWRGKKLRFIN